MPTRIPHRELRNNSSAILRAVQAGETFTITNHDVPVAVLAPIGTTAAAAPASRKPRAKASFAELESVTLDHPAQQTLDLLRER